LDSKKFWNDETVEQYPYTYYVWLGKCPFCLWSVKEGQVQEPRDKGLAVCPNCESKIQVNWVGIGKNHLDFTSGDVELIYKEVLFDEVCEKLKSPDYFIFTVGFEDLDETDNYTNILIENPDIVKAFLTPSHNLAFLCQANAKTQNIFGFRNLADTSVMLLAVSVTPPAVGKEDGRVFSYVKNKDREALAQLFRSNYEEILDKHTFIIKEV
jgi:hypothetical protein